MIHIQTRWSAGRVGLRSASAGLLLTGLVTLGPACAGPGRGTAPSPSVRTSGVLDVSAVVQTPVDGRTPGPAVVRDLTGTWDRRRAAARLLEVSPVLALADAAVDEARAGLARVRSATAPRVDLGLVGTSSDNPAQVFMGELNAGELDLAGGLDDTDPTTHVTAALSASLLLWDGGRTEALERAAVAGIEAGRAAREADARQLLLRLDALWFGLLEARARIEGLEARGPALEAALAGARARRAAGTGLASEVLSLESRALERETGLRNARSGEARLVRSLDLLLELSAVDHDYAGAFDLGGSLPDPGALLAEARAARPDLAAAEGLVAAREAELEAARRTGGPTLSAFADGWLDGGTPAWELDRGTYRLGASLGWSLLDGGAREADRAGARARLRAAQARLAAAVQAVELELFATRVDVELAEATRELALRRVVAAEAALAELGEGYEAGAVSLERWLGAEADLADARTGALLADLDLARAWAALDLARGRQLATAPTALTPTPTPDPTPDPMSDTTPDATPDPTIDR